MLSAKYDGALDNVVLSREDPDSLLVEHLLLDECARRRGEDFLSLKASVLGHAPLPNKERGKILLDVLDRGRELLYPWLVEESTPEQKQKSEDEQIKDFYYRVMDAYKKHKKSEREKQEQQAAARGPEHGTDR
jgi:hypothetical protein